MNKFLYVFFLLFCLLLSSCKVVNSISIDYLLPADVSYPEGIKTVAVVNNTLQDSIGRKRVLNNISNTDNRELGVIDCDSKTVTEELAQNLADANYFDQVVICDSALRQNDHSSRENRLSQEEVRELSEDLGVDMIVSLEDANMAIKRRYFHVPDYTAVQSSLDATVNTVVRLYLPVRAIPLVTLSDKDSIYWIINSRSLTEEIVKEASSFAATLPVRHLVPTWTTVDRYYYASGSVDLRDAAVYVKENEWDKAFELWSKVNKEKNEKFQMYSAFNIALYYEMKDNLEAAKEWCEKARDLADKKQRRNSKGEVTEPTQDYAMTSLYLLDLDKRMNNVSKLTLQMDRFKGDF